jgi:hypothetical protein
MEMTSAVRSRPGTRPSMSARAPGVSRATVYTLLKGARHEPDAA